MDTLARTKPLMRGHFHQAAFFISIGACAMLIAKSSGAVAVAVTVIYSITLMALFGISALYHRPMWGEKHRAVMKRLDHSAIFLIIGGTCAPVCLLGLGGDLGIKLFFLVASACCLGIVQSVFWPKAPRWLTAALYVGVGWLIVPFSSELLAALGPFNTFLLFFGGILYTLGAVIYAFKWFNYYPKFFGYHEVFHTLVVIAAACHFILVYRIE